MSCLALALVLLERKETEDTAEVSLCHVSAIHMFVGNFGQSAHCIFSGFHTIRGECLISSRDSLDQSDSAGQQWGESLFWKDVCEGTETV